MDVSNATSLGFPATDVSQYDDQVQDSQFPPSVAEQTTSHVPEGHIFPQVNIGGINSRVHLGDNYYNIDPTTSSRSQDDQHKEELLKVLYFPEADKRFNYLEEKYSTTFDWIWEPPDRDKPPWDSFVDWLKGDTKTYWILGKLGSGKSTLMKYIIESLRDKDNDHVFQLCEDYVTGSDNILSFFFYQPGVGLEKSVLGCLRSLLWQLVGRISPNNLRQTVIPVEFLHSMSKLYKALERLLHDIGVSTLIFLDGLDECCDTDAMLKTLSLLQDLPNVKLCVSSRPEQAYLYASTEIPKLKLQDLNYPDISLFIQQELIENPTVQNLGSETKGAPQEITESLQFKAQGVFLWVRLVVKSLLRGLRNRDSMDDLVKRVEQLPEDINALYLHMIQRLDNDAEIYARDAVTFYQLATIDDLTLLEICFIINSDLRRKYLDLDTYAMTEPSRIGQDIDGDLIATRINVCSAGLLEVVEDGRHAYNHAVSFRLSGRLFSSLKRRKIQFIHRSAYQFVLERPDGRHLLAGSSVSEFDNLKAIFEAIVISETIVPAVLCNRMGWSCVFEVFSRGRSFSKWSQYPSWIHDLETICQQLCDKGLALTVSPSITTYRWAYIHDNPLPGLQTGHVDFAIACARTGYVDLLRSKLSNYDGSCEQSYLSCLLMQVALGGVEYDGVNIWEVIESFGGDMNSPWCGESGERTYPILWFATRRSATPEIWSLLLNRGADAQITCPVLCEDFFQISQSTRHSTYEQITIFGSFCAEDLYAWNHGKHDSIGMQASQSYVVMHNISLPQLQIERGLLAIPKNVVGIVCDNVNAIVKLKNGFICRPGVIELFVENAPEIHSLLVEISRHCEHLTAGVEALRHMGKTEEMILSAAAIHRECNLRSLDLSEHYEEFERWFWGTETRPPRLHSGEDQPTETEVCNDCGEDIESIKAPSNAEQSLAECTCAFCLTLDEVD